jgi:hypothetical protein
MKVIEDDVVHGRGVNMSTPDEIGLLGDEHRSILRRVGKTSVRAADEGGIERNDIHQIAKAELFLQNAEAHPRHGRLQSRIQEQFSRVVSGLSVDVHRSGVIGGAVVIHPEVIGEPRVGLSQDNEISGPLMVQAGRTPATSLQNGVYAGLIF